MMMMMKPGRRTRRCWIGGMSCFFDDELTLAVSGILVAALGKPGEGKIFMQGRTHNRSRCAR